MNYRRIYPCLLVRQVDQFDRLTPPNQLSMAPCQLAWQEPKSDGLKMIQACKTLALAGQAGKGPIN